MRELIYIVSADPSAGRTALRALAPSYSDAVSGDAVRVVVSASDMDLVRNACPVGWDLRISGVASPRHPDDHYLAAVRDLETT